MARQTGAQARLRESEALQRVAQAAGRAWRKPVLSLDGVPHGVADGFADQLAELEVLACAL